MKFIAWNVNHRASRKRIPPEMVEAVCSLSPDIIVLTEYVPGPSHKKFTSQLSSSGFPYLCMSAYSPKENHVLIASRSEVVPGDITGPPIAPSVPSNVLHVHLKRYEMDVLGLRVPDYSKQPIIRRACWDWIETIAGSVIKQPFIFLGDFNVDPSYPRSRCGDRISKLVAAGWQHAVPRDGVSYWPVAGGEGKQLDHAFVSRHFTVRCAQYVWEANHYIFAGNNAGAMSDHAVLVVDIDRHQNLRNAMNS